MTSGDINGGDGEEENMDSWHLLYLLVSIINFIFHGIACLLLMVTYKQKGTKKTSQHLLLANICFTELLLNACVSVEFGILLCLKHGMVQYDSVSSVQLFVQNLHFTTILYLYFSAMFLVTADRLAATCLNIRYTVYDIRYKVVCTVRRTKFTLLSVWLAVIFVSGGFLAYNYVLHSGFWLYRRENIFKTFVVYIPVGLSLLFLGFSLLSFTVMGLRCVRMSNISSHLTTSQMFKSSKYYVSVLLILTFIFFMVIPFLVYTFAGHLLPPIVVTVLGLSTYLSDTAHFLVCLFCYRPVVVWLRKRVVGGGGRWRIEAGLLGHRMAPGCEHWSGPGPKEAAELLIQTESPVGMVRRKSGTSDPPLLSFLDHEPKRATEAVLAPKRKSGIIGVETEIVSSRRRKSGCLGIENEIVSTPRRKSEGHKFESETVPTTPRRKSGSHLPELLYLNENNPQLENELVPIRRRKSGTSDPPELLTNHLATESKPETGLIPPRQRKNGSPIPPDIDSLDTEIHLNPNHKSGTQFAYEVIIKSDSDSKPPTVRRSSNPKAGANCSKPEIEPDTVSELAAPKLPRKRKPTPTPETIVKKYSDGRMSYTETTL